MSTFGKSLKKRPVRDMHTGERWGSISEAARAIGVSAAGLNMAIASHRPCQGRWIVAVDELPPLCACCKAELAA